MSFCNVCGEEIIFRYVNGILKPIHISGDCCRGERSLLAKQSKSYLYNWDYSHITRIEDYISYVNPNVECHCCGELIHFYQSPYGGKVFFESPLGPPWKKHCCNIEKGCCERQGDNPKSVMSLTSENKLINHWKVYFLVSVRKFRMITKLKQIVLKSLFDEKEYTFYIHKEIELKEGSLVFVRKLCPKYGELSFYKEINPVDEILISEEQNTPIYYSKAKKYFPKLFFSFKRYKQEEGSPKDKKSKTKKKKKKK